MIENINLKDYPQASGVYWFICNDEIVYIGSSKNLYDRMGKHRCSIKRGSSDNKKSQQSLYQFLQQNQFEIQFKLTENYRVEEQNLIEKHNPRFNQQRAFCGVGSKKGRSKEYRKAYYNKFREECLGGNLNWNHNHREQLNDYCNQYYRQKCLFNGEVLTLQALAARFRRQGTKHSTQEAKKYLIEEKELHIL